MPKRHGARSTTDISKLGAKSSSGTRTTMTSSKAVATELKKKFRKVSRSGPRHS